MSFTMNIDRIKKINCYVPAKSSRLGDREPLNFGLFGSSEEGRKYVIDSFFAALAETRMGPWINESGITRYYRLTDAINVVEVMSMKDFSDEELEESVLIIRGIKCGSLNFDAIHCPIFIYEPTEDGVKGCGTFLKNISKRVREMHGRDVFIVILYEGNVPNDIISEPAELPSHNVFLLKRLSPDEDRDGKYNLEILDMIWDCVKRGEPGAKFWKDQEKMWKQRKYLSQGFSGFGLVGAGTGIGSAIGIVGGPIGIAIGAVVGTGIGAILAATSVTGIHLREQGIRARKRLERKKTMASPE